MTTSNPQTSVVTAEINMYTVIKALTELVEKYPAERLSFEQAYEVLKAGETMFDRAWEYSQRGNFKEGMNGRMPTCL